ncbi:MAG: DUF294 nucleotidyltransferase-like domain-containing protein [Pseudomonadota bacterium]
MLAELNATPLTALEAVALDTETTGLDASKDRVVQLGAIGIRGRTLREDDRFETLVNPGVKIPKLASSIHGIYDEDLVSAPTPGPALKSLVEFIGPRVIIGYSIAFDLRILSREAAATERVWPNYRALDVRPLALAVAPSLADYSLETVCAWLEVENTRRHSAMGDAVATAEVFIRLLPLLRERKIRTLAEAEAVCRTVEERESIEHDPALDRAYSTADQEELQAFRNLDSYPFSHHIGDVMSSPALKIDGDSRVIDALELLLTRHTSSVFVEVPDGPFGIVTERDLLRALGDGQAASFNKKLKDIMKSPVHSVRADDLMYRAIGRLDRIGVRHLAVVDHEDALVGAVTTHNLLRHRALAAMTLGDEIEAARDETDLGQAWSKVSAVARSLQDQEVRVDLITNVISSEIRALTEKAALVGEARLLEAGQGAPPYPYCVLVLGSAGRGESMISADQDNAIIVAAEQLSPDEDAWYEALGGHMADILDGVGVVYCQGGVMAKNAAWRRSRTAWRAEIETWVNRQDPDSLLFVDIFYDAITVHGDEDLGRQVWEEAFDLGSHSPSFLRALEGTMASWRAPLGLLGNFQTGSDERVDLKLRGLFPIVAAARILSIKTNTPARSTAERIRNAAAAGAISESAAQSLERAYGTIMAAILQQQLLDVEAGRSPGPRVNPGILDKHHQKALKDAIKQSGEAVQLVREGMF